LGAGSLIPSSCNRCSALAGRETSRVTICSFKFAPIYPFPIALELGVVSRIVFRAEVFQSKRPDRGYLRDVLAGFRPVEMGRVARQNDHGAGRIREREVMVLVASGLLNKQVGGELGISEITVKAHRGQVMQKMKANSFADLVNKAARLGLRPCAEKLTLHRPVKTRGPDH
jgi:DNA-binding CsgD family transcriptional regulator